jgi:hypothetical protein
MCRHRGFLRKRESECGQTQIETKEKGHHPVADDGPFAILNLSSGYIIRWR